MDGQHNASATTVGDARRAQIVHAARAICLEKGFSKITISDIAGRVGMTRSLFYHYFQDKDQVADAVLDDVIDEVISQLEEWNANREVGNISKALDDVVRLTRSLIADEGPFSQRMILYRAKKQHVNPWLQEVFKGTRDYEQAIARQEVAA